MSLFQLNTPALPASRRALLNLGAVGLVMLNTLVVLFVGALAHHYDIGLRWFVIGAAVTALGYFPARFAAQQLWQWVAGTTALNGPGLLFAKSVAWVSPCLLAAIALFVIAAGNYLGARVPLMVQGVYGTILGAIIVLGLVICCQEIKRSIHQHRAG